MFVVQKKIGSTDNFGYLIGNEKAKVCAIIDPSFDSTQLVEEAKKRGCKVEYVLVTHHHYDHVYDCSKLRETLGAKVVAHGSSPLPKDIAVRGGDELPLGSERVKVLHTPGHTFDSVCFQYGRNLFTGDTLFVGECGRCDLPGSKPEDMYDSLFDVLSKLDDDIVVYPGHDYGKAPRSTIGREKKENYVLKPRTKKEFVKFVLE